LLDGFGVLAAKCSQRRVIDSMTVSKPHEFDVAFELILQGAATSNIAMDSEQKHRSENSRSDRWLATFLDPVVLFKGCSIELIEQFVK
jgi:hypothetical protein